MGNPKHNPRLFFCPSEVGISAYDPETDRIHRLNASASLILELCDGQRSEEAICQLLSALLPETAVRQCIAQGFAQGLLCEEGTVPTEDPQALIRELRASGRIEAAYICQYQLAEDEPEEAEHWGLLGELARILGRREAARNAYERYLKLRPEDGEVRHLLTAMEGQSPARAPDEAILHLYTRFAPFYESNMLEELDYQAPKHLGEQVQAWMGDRKDLEALDLGCGTGLAGLEIRPKCQRLIGVDLSPQMLALARERGIYDRLDCAEISAWLEASQDRFDLIVSCDALIYFGDLKPVLQPARRLLKAGGCFCFTLEQGTGPAYRLSDSGRYVHSPEGVRQMAAETGWRVRALESRFLRMEYGEPVLGLVVVLV